MISLRNRIAAFFAGILLVSPHAGAASVMMPVASVAEAAGFSISIGDGPEQGDLISLLEPAGSWATFAIHASGGNAPGSLLGTSAVFTTVGMGEVEQALVSALLLGPGEYWLVTSLAHAATGPGSTNIVGYSAISFVLSEEWVVTGVGVETGQAGDVLLRVQPVPEPGAIVIAAVGCGLGWMRRRR